MKHGIYVTAKPKNENGREYTAYYEFNSGFLRFSNAHENSAAHEKILPSLAEHEFFKKIIESDSIETGCYQPTRV